MIFNRLHISDEVWSRLIQAAAMMTPQSTPKDLLNALIPRALDLGLATNDKVIVVKGEVLQTLQGLVGKSVANSDELVKELKTLTSVSVPGGTEVGLNEDDLMAIKNICEGMGFTSDNAVGDFIRDAVHQQLYGSTIY